MPVNTRPDFRFGAIAPPSSDRRPVTLADVINLRFSGCKVGVQSTTIPPMGTIVSDIIPMKDYIRIALLHGASPLQGQVMAEKAQTGVFR